MKNFTLKHKAGPFGDETSDYDVIVNKPEATVQDLIEHCLSSGEWGYIEIGQHQLEYYDAKPIHTIKYDDIPEKIKQKKIKKVTASGGWSRMDYYVIV